MSYVDKNLIPGEQVIYKTRLHWVVIFSHIFWMLVFLIAGSFLLAGMPGLTNVTEDARHFARIGAIVVLAMALLFFVLAIIRRSSVEMAVTNKRVTVKVGLLSHATEEMMLNRIESIMVDQSLMGRIFNFGTITLRGVGGTPDPFPRIAHPLEFRRQVQHQLDLMQSAPPVQIPPQS